MNTQLNNPIVVGVDGSDESRLAVRYAVLEAKRSGCALRLVHATPETVPVAPRLPVISGMPLITAETLDQVSHRIVNEAKQLAYDMTDGEIHVEKVIQPGSRMRVLAKAAEDARLIVLGHRDRSILGRLFTSSTCVGVTSRAHCPVVCVPSDWTRDVTRARVVVGVEGPEHSQDALAVAFAVAAERKAKLTVLHAWKLQAPYDEILVSEDVDEWTKSASAMLEEILRDWRQAYPEVDVEIDVRHQYTVPALVGASEGADLLILGRHGRGSPLGFHLGSTVRTLIRESHCPVEIAPHHTSQALLPGQRQMTADQVSPQA